APGPAMGAGRPAADRPPRPVAVADPAVDGPPGPAVPAAAADPAAVSAPLAGEFQAPPAPETFEPVRERVPPDEGGPPRRGGRRPPRGAGARGAAPAGVRAGPLG